MANARRSHVVWSEHIAACRRSGLGSAEYARRHGLHPSTLAWWRWKLKKVEANDAPALRLVPVKTGPASRAVAPVELVLPSGVVMKLPADAAPDQIAALVAALVRSC